MTSIDDTIAEVLRLDEATTRGPWVARAGGHVTSDDGTVAIAVLARDADAIALYREFAPELAREGTVLISSPRHLDGFRPSRQASPMAILRAREAWTKTPTPANETRRSHDLTPAERANVRAAIHVLRRRLGGYRALAIALRVKEDTLKGYGCVRPPSAAVAIRVARLAKVPVDDVLTGAWPPAGACPHCGRSQT